MAPIPSRVPRGACRWWRSPPGRKQKHPFYLDPGIEFDAIAAAQMLKYYFIKSQNRK